jgi:hypothetical protein
MQHDSKNQPYLEIEIDGGTSIRLTAVTTWSTAPGIRINIKDANNHLRPGPEIPFENIPELQRCLSALILNHQYGETNHQES